MRISVYFKTEMLVDKGNKKLKTTVVADTLGCTSSDQYKIQVIKRKLEELYIIT